MKSERLAALARHLGDVDIERRGRVTGVVGPVVRALVPDVHLGELCAIDRREGRVIAEVLGFDGEQALLMPYEPMGGIAVHAAVHPLGSTTEIPAGDALLGRVIDALGAPLDGLGPIRWDERVPITSAPPNPLTRQPIDRLVETGIRALDSLLPLGRGQRVGLFAAAGGGKSTLLSQLARNVKADRVVLALIGERGREVLPFLRDDLGEAGLSKSTVIVSTADESPLKRMRAAHAATAIAEHARDRGHDVVLMMDSVTRFARALREIGLATGEPMGQGGFPASVFASLPMLFERAGNSAHGSITGIYTVLVAGDNIEEPVADETMSLLDGHILLSRKLASRNHYPAIDVPRSKSRLMRAIHRDERKRDLVAYANEVLGFFEQQESKIRMGLFEPRNVRERKLVEDHELLMGFLRQGETPSDVQETWGELERLFGSRELTAPRS